MNGIETIEQRVYEVLFVNPDARNNDDICYISVLKNLGIDVDSITVGSFFTERTKVGFPNIETVRRTRQKLQARYEELRATDRVRTKRRISEQMFKDYAREK